MSLGLENYKCDTQTSYHILVGSAYILDQEACSKPYDILPAVTKKDIRKRPYVDMIIYTEIETKKQGWGRGEGVCDPPCPEEG